MNPQVLAALQRARATGQPQYVSVNGVTMMAHPDGSLGGFGGTAQFGSAGVTSPTQAVTPQPVAPSAPSSNYAGYQGSIGTPSGPAPSTGAFGATAPTAPSPVSPQGGARSPYSWLPPASSTMAPNYGAQGFAGVQGLPGGPSGPAVMPPGQMPEMTVTAQRYRQAHMPPQQGMTADMLNAQSLLAAQSGRNYMTAQQLQPGQNFTNLLVNPNVQNQGTQYARNPLTGGLWG